MKSPLCIHRISLSFNFTSCASQVSVQRIKYSLNNFAFGASWVPGTNYMQPKANNLILKFSKKKRAIKIPGKKLLSLTNQIIRYLTAGFFSVRRWMTSESFSFFVIFHFAVIDSQFLVQSWVLQDRTTRRQAHHSNLQGRTDSLCHPRLKSFPKVVGDGWSVALHSWLSWLLWGSITRSAFYTPSCYRSTKNPRRKPVCWFVW